MKRALSLLLCVALLLTLLSACQEPASESTATVSPTVAEIEWTVGELVNLAFEHSGCEDIDGLEAISADLDRETLIVYIENVYGIQESWEDAALVRATGMSAFEIAVLRMEDSTAAAQAVTALEDYIANRQGDFVGYAPAEADMVANGSIIQDGPFVALFICLDVDYASEVVTQALKGEILPEPEPTIPADAITDVKELRDWLVSYCGMEETELELLDDSDSDALNAYIEDSYGLNRNQWMECAIARGTGDSAFEVAVMTGANDWALSSDIKKSLDWYLNSKQIAFQDNAEEKSMLSQAVSAGGVARSEEYVYIVLLACKEAKQTANAFAETAATYGVTFSTRNGIFQEDPNYSGRILFVQPNKIDMSFYDTTAICTAWNTGDVSGLSSYDRDIYDAAKVVLNEVLKEDMNDLEKEIAIYDWLVSNVNYDGAYQDVMKETSGESATPYGGLVNRTAICLGYVTTFQLLMDLAEVECITVAGATFSSQEDHGWNMVRIDGNWYCTDVTWDANRQAWGGGGEKDWRFFNITSDDMAATDHQWDYANTPEAITTGNGWG